MVDTMYQARAVTVATGAGIAIRYSFYLAGLFVFGAIAIGIMWAFSNRPKLVETEPSFRITGSEIARLPSTSEVVTSGSIGRSEARLYGNLYGHSPDMAVILVTPPDGRPIARDFATEMGIIPNLRRARPRFKPVFYDLETRFGTLRAAEMQVDADGRRKLCLAYLSRFDTPYVYLKGWICEASGAQPSAGALACLINGLALDRALPSREAEAYMRARASRGGFCQATPVTQTTDTRPYRPAPRRYY